MSEYRSELVFALPYSNSQTSCLQGDIARYTSFSKKTKTCIVLGYVDGSSRFNVKVLKCGSNNLFEKVEHISSDKLSLFARPPTHSAKPGTKEHTEWVNLTLPSGYNSQPYTVYHPIFARDPW